MSDKKDSDFERSSIYLSAVRPIADALVQYDLKANPLQFVQLGAKVPGIVKIKELGCLRCQLCGHHYAAKGLPNLLCKILAPHAAEIRQLYDPLPPDPGSGASHPPALMSSCQIPRTSGRSSATRTLGFKGCARTPAARLMSRTC